MRELGPLETIIYNEGERLIPYVTHNHNELVRHRSSYVFWRAIVELDLPRLREPVTIVDLGCGVGHGCATLAEIPGTQVVGVDTSAESLDYAARHYARPNIEYVRGDLVEYIPSMRPFDYAVSRGAMEHIPDGLELTRQSSWRQRLMFDVPYAEAKGVNPHHVVHDVKEHAFGRFGDAEVFFQDLAGVTYDLRRKPERPNMIVCVVSRPGLARASRELRFPIDGWDEGKPPPRRASAYERLANRLRDR
jgi:SAM-dependent methyltransferase